MSQRISRTRAKRKLSLRFRSLIALIGEDMKYLENGKPACEKALKGLLFYSFWQPYKTWVRRNTGSGRCFIAVKKRGIKGSEASVFGRTLDRRRGILGFQLTVNEAGPTDLVRSSTIRAG